ncbi:MAG: hypothetical protein KDE27_18110 [Planctomycetes bacterium]|nr:hypothetical protein [Planctomycetota bacterium]
MHRSVLEAVTVAALAAPLFGQSDDPAIQSVLPARLLQAEGSASSTLPFGFASRRIQIAYGRDTIGEDGAVTIAGIALRPDGSLTSVQQGSWGITLEVSTCTRAPGALSRTFDDNHGVDRRQVFFGTVTATPVTLAGAPNRFELVIPFTRQFLWEPRCGGLLFDFQVQSASGAGFLADALTDGTESYGLIANLGSASAATANHPATGVERRAPAIDLLLATTIAAEPAPGQGIVSGYPWSTVATQMRVMDVYQAGALVARLPQRISRLGWRTRAGSTHLGRRYDLKVTLSTGAPGLAGALSTTFAANHGPDATVVFDGIFDSIPFQSGNTPSGFELSLPLTREFDWDPAKGALVVDLQLRSITGPPVGSFHGTNSIATARIMHLSSASAAVANSAPQSYAYTLALGGVATPILPEPEPTAITATSSFPWNTTNGMRVQYAYDASALGSTGVQEIHQLGWRLDSSNTVSYGPASYPVTIDLSTGPMPAANLTAVFDNNHGSDRVRVFDGAVNAPFRDGPVAPLDFSITATLDRPFRWNPAAGPLIVDIRTPQGLLAGTIGRRATGKSGPGAMRVTHRTDPNASVADLGPQNYAFDLRINGPWCRGHVEPYGVPCGGLLALTRGDAALGTTDFTIELHNAPAGKIAPAGFALGKASIDLSPFGAVGCTGLTTGDLGVIWFVTDPAGVARTTMPLPNAPGLQRLRFFQQWLVLDQAAPGGVLAAGGLQITVGG